MGKKINTIIAISGICGCFFVIKKLYSELNDVEEEVNKKRLQLWLFEKWIMNCQKNLYVEFWFKKKGYSNIGIYGCGMAGKRLIDELKGSKDVSVIYIVDKNVDLYLDINIYKDIPNQLPVDVIVVTVVAEFEDIKEELKQKGIRVPIVSIEDVVFEMD